MILRWLLGVLTGAIALLAGGVVLVLATDSGTAWLAREAQRFTPDVLYIGPMSGNLLAGVRLERIDIRAGHTTVGLSDVHARVAAAGFLQGRVELSTLDIGELAIVVKPDPEDRSPIHVPTIRVPVPIELPAVRISRLGLHTDEFERIATGLTASIALRRSHLDIRDLRARSGEAAVALAGEAELRHPLPLHATAHWSWDRPALQGDGTVSGDLELLTIEQVIRGPGRVSLHTELRGLADHPVLDGTASWDALFAAVAGLGVVTSPGGRLNLAGNWDEWRGSLSARLAVPKLPAATAAVAVHGARGHMNIDELRVGGAFGLLTGSGTVELESSPEFALDLRARDIDPGAVRPDARGRLAARLRLSGRPPDAFDAEISELEGTLMGRPAAGRVSVSRRGGDWDVRDIDLSAGPNRLAGTGRFGNRIEGRFRLDAPRLDIIWPALEGSLHGHADIGGTVARPVGAIELSGRNLKAGDRHVRTLEFQGRIESRAALHVNIDAAEILIGAAHLGRLRARASGRLAQHTLEAGLSGGMVTASLAGHGAWTGSALREEFTAATISAARLGEWRLQRTGVGAEISSVHAGVADHCWLRADASLCFANLHWSPDAASMAATLRGLPIEGIRDLMPEDWTVAGTAAADVALSSDGAGMHGKLNVDIQHAALSFAGDDEQIVRTFPVATLSAELTPTLLTGHAEISGDAGVRVRADGRLDDPLTPGGSLTGRLDGEIPDLGDLLPLLIPGNSLSDISGRLTFDALIGGTRAAPRVSGEVAVHDGTLALTDIGMRMSAINLSARGNETATLAVEGSARSGGDVSLAGSVELTGEGAPAGTLRIRGRDLDAIRLPDRYVRASPDITLSYRAGRLSVGGTIEIPKADIVVAQLPTSATSRSPDAVVHDRPAPVSARDAGAALKIDGDLKFVFGDAVRLKAFGLDTRLAGALRVYQTPDGYAAGDGVVRLEEGKFKAYGKELEIERGNLMFSGPLDNPGLDVRASRRVDYEGESVTVGLQLSGSAEQAESRVFSDPAMGEADALSYLVANRPLTKVTAKDQASVTSAALSLGLGQTAPITQQIGQAVALDELGFSGDDLKQTEIVAGKQIGPDLYVRFAYGLFNRVGSILARYRIGKRLSIEASSGEQQSLDLVYSIETN